jgi:hypothetical protein
MLPAFGTCCARAALPEQSVTAAKAANWASLFGIGVHGLYPHLCATDLTKRRAAAPGHVIRSTATRVIS